MGKLHEKKHILSLILIISNILMCLDGLNVLDLSDIQLEFIAKSAFYSITAQWQPVLVQFRWITVIYGVTGVNGITSTLLSITFITKYQHMFWPSLVAMHSMDYIYLTCVSIFQDNEKIIYNTDSIALTIPR